MHTPMYLLYTVYMCLIFLEPNQHTDSCNTVGVIAACNATAKHTLALHRVQPLGCTRPTSSGISQPRSPLCIRVQRKPAGSDLATYRTKLPIHSTSRWTRLFLLFSCRYDGSHSTCGLYIYRLMTYNPLPSSEGFEIDIFDSAHIYSF